MSRLWTTTSCLTVPPLTHSLTGSLCVMARFPHTRKPSCSHLQKLGEQRREAAAHDGRHVVARGARLGAEPLLQAAATTTTSTTSVTPPTCPNVRFCRYRFPAADLNSKATLIWDSIKPVSNVCFQFQQTLQFSNKILKILNNKETLIQWTCVLTLRAPVYFNSPVAAKPVAAKPHLVPHGRLRAPLAHRDPRCCRHLRASHRCVGGMSEHCVL